MGPYRIVCFHLPDSFRTLAFLFSASNFSYCNAVYSLIMLVGTMLLTFMMLWIICTCASLSVEQNLFYFIKLVLYCVCYTGAAVHGECLFTAIWTCYTIFLTTYVKSFLFSACLILKSELKRCCHWPFLINLQQKPCQSGNCQGNFDTNDKHCSKEDGAW
jgi:hypothetical protein